MAEDNHSSFLKLRNNKCNRGTIANGTEPQESSEGCLPECGVSMTTNFLDKIGSVGAVLAAAAIPCSFSVLSIVGSALGLSFLAPYQSYVVYAMQILAVVALIGYGYHVSRSSQRCTAFNRHRVDWSGALFAEHKFRYHVALGRIGRLTCRCCLEYSRGPEMCQ